MCFPNRTTFHFYGCQWSFYWSLIKRMFWDDHFLIWPRFGWIGPTISSSVIAGEANLSGKCLLFIDWIKNKKIIFEYSRKFTVSYPNREPNREWSFYLSWCLLTMLTSTRLSVFKKLTKLNFKQIQKINGSSWSKMSVRSSTQTHLRLLIWSWRRSIVVENESFCFVFSFLILFML